MRKMTSVQNIKLTWRLVSPPPPAGAACSCARSDVGAAAARRAIKRDARIVCPEERDSRGRHPGVGRARNLSTDVLQLNEQGDDDGEQRGALDERREDERTR